MVARTLILSETARKDAACGARSSIRSLKADVEGTGRIPGMRRHRMVHRALDNHTRIRVLEIYESSDGTELCSSSTMSSAACR
jgi:hypothetical protein